VVADLSKVVLSNNHFPEGMPSAKKQNHGYQATRNRRQKHHALFFHCTDRRLNGCIGGIVPTNFSLK
jgi:carbonic anhydrase